MKTEEKLDKLSELQKTIEFNRKVHDAQKATLLPPEIKVALDRMDAEFDEKQAEVGKQIDEITTEIKLDTINFGSTVRGTFLMATWNKARETVDMKQLKGYAVAHPEVNSMIKTGEPTCTIRKIGKGE